MVTALFTAVVHSSAATIGFAIALASGGALELDHAIYWVYGANIGTTATALIASTGGNYVGKQVAWAHCFYKIAGALYLDSRNISSLLWLLTILAEHSKRSYIF
ncbi:MAG: Na/Pi symporter [Bdellovibrionales bacterium]